jgi:hypothetical protein
MSKGLRLPALAAVLLVGLASADVPMHPALSIERFENGNTLIAVGSSYGLSAGLAIEVDSLCRLVWAYVRGDIPWAHSARRIPGGNTLITATNDGRVIEITPLGNVVWEMSQGLPYPNEAWRLANGNTLITDKSSNRVIEVDSGRNVVWSYTNLLGPHNGNPLANGNTLICDSDRNQVIEVTPDGQVVWQYATGLYWPRSAQRLANGNTLITDSNNRRVIEVDSAGIIAWEYHTVFGDPYMAIRLANGNTLTSATGLVVEVDQSQSIVWQYPPAAPVVETCRVANPASGCSLYVHIHRPATAGPANLVPAVVLVPDLSSPGTIFDDTTLADHIASDGFAVLHFDAEGRGRSSGTEDYNGYVHQDGLHACAAFLAQQPYVDTAQIGIYSQGYGVVMATGMLARHSQPKVKFLLDFEGPSDRYQVCSDSGGHVPVSPDSESFWLEREAGRFIKHVPCAYLRIQTEIDHTGRMLNNEHAIALIDSATSTIHGGAGMCVWTRINDSVMNGENVVYTVSQPPEWISEDEEANLLCRELLYLHELETRSFPGAISGSSSIVPRSLFSVFPNPCHASVRIRISPQLQTANCKLVTIYLRRFRPPRAVRSCPHFVLRTSHFVLCSGRLPRAADHRRTHHHRQTGRQVGP